MVQAAGRPEQDGACLGGNTVHRPGKSRAAPPAQFLRLPHQLALAAIPITPRSVWLLREVGLEMRTEEDRPEPEGATAGSCMAAAPSVRRQKKEMIMLARSNKPRSDQSSNAEDTTKKNFGNKNTNHTLLHTRRHSFALLIVNSPH